MKPETHSAAWTSVGWAGLGLFLLTWLELALPIARKLLASILPLQVFACLIVASGLCIAAGFLRRDGFFSLES